MITTERPIWITRVHGCFDGPGMDSPPTRHPTPVVEEPDQLGQRCHGTRRTRWPVEGLTVRQGPPQTDCLPPCLGRSVGGSRPLSAQGLTERHVKKEKPPP